jgi:ATP-dependent DNA helicase RecG
MNIGKILSFGESVTVEFKEGFDREVIETVTAFSNTRGGVIFIGVNDKGEVKGLSIGRETLKGWANQISQATEPTVIPEVDTEELNGKTIVLVRVQEFPLKPVATRGRCFRRVSNSNRQMSPQEIAQMHLHATGSSWDALPATDATIEDIDVEKVNKYIQEASATGRRKFGDNQDPINLLEKLELVRDGKPTWASILLFGKRPQSPLTQAQVHCGRFKEETIIVDDRLIEGSIIDQIDEVMDFIRKNINVRFLITGESRRDEVWDYPLDALREAVVNALCHRDYGQPSDIQIKIYDDRILVWSPGLLPFGITIEELYQQAHSSQPRNKLIAQVFYDISLIERYGSGTLRMISACVNASLPEPVFEERFGGVLVTLRKEIYTEEYLQELGLNERQIKAAIYVKEKGAITNKEYRELHGVSDRTALRELKDMTLKKILERIGETGRTTKYILARQTRQKPDINPTG